MVVWQSTPCQITAICEPSHDQAETGLPGRYIDFVTLLWGSPMRSRGQYKSKASAQTPEIAHCSPALYQTNPSKSTTMSFTASTQGPSFVMNDQDFMELLESFKSDFTRIRIAALQQQYAANCKRRMTS